ncbi:REP-associated tyrosine transposase [Oleiharenicola lentus]|uniref:REP-associated tyrosine transposase n=1 Tax=Oleiharenicola lentus TaxID=2508720 RepID=UPI003F67E6C2
MKRNSGPNALRRGRSFRPFGDYFITICVEPRTPALTGKTAEKVLSICHTLKTDQAWLIRCATVMPDHIHLLVTLGDILTLSQTIAKLKVGTKQSISSSSARWQNNFYDHQLRHDESAEPVVRYIYLNPYEARLIPREKSWPHFFCCPKDWAWFRQLTDSEQPYPEWLR